jgi:ATP-binding cassette, subfamily B, bacterial
MSLRVWRSYAARFRGAYGRAVLGAGLALATGLVLVPIPLLVGYAFDTVIPGGRTGALIGVSVGILGLQMLSGAGMLATRYVVLGVTKQVSAHIRREALARLLAAPKRDYNRRDLSSLHDVVVHETERVDVMTSALLAEVGPAVALSLGVCGALVALNWMLFVCMLAVAPLNVVAGRRLGRFVQRRVADFHESFGRFSRSVLFLVRAIDLTRIQAAEAVESTRQNARIEELRTTSRVMGWTAISYTVAQQMLVALSGVVVLIVGGVLAASGRLTIGGLLSFFAGIMLLRSPLHTMMVGVPRIMEGAQSLRAVMAFLGETTREPYQGRTRIPFTGGVALRDVSFDYGSGPVLTGVSLDLAPGEIVALVGPNGSGKSTIVNLILGFYRPVSGGVFAGDTSYDTLDMQDLRRAIGVATQDPLLVPGTIRDNLTYGAPDAPAADIQEAARLAGVDTFAASLPDGYDAPIGEDGRLLSGGQRQRLSLARALLGRPKLLILDEPLSHLDEADGAAFLDRLASAAHRPAVLLISHRREAVAMAHRVYRIARGRIVGLDDQRAAAARPVAATG